MMSLTKNGYVYTGCLIAFFLAIFLQSMAIVNPDVAYLLHDTRLFLQGGTYVKDFFETNPPMIFVLYSPIIILANVSGYDASLIAYIYFFAIAFISLLLSAWVLKKIIVKAHVSLYHKLLVALAVVFLIIPVVSFGQREHLLLMMSMPYFLLIAARVESAAIPAMMAAVIGLMAGLVFSLKPFFLAPVIFAEGYLLITKKNVLSSFRVESVVAASVILFYLGFVATFHPLYFSKLMPLISAFYFKSTTESWPTILATPVVVLALLLMGYFIFFAKRSSHSTLRNLLLMMLMGYVLAFLIPRSAWSYHVLPAYAVSVLLLVVLFHDLCQQKTFDRLRMSERFFLFILVFLMPIAIFYMDVKSAYKKTHSTTYATLLNVMKPLGGKSIFCFSSFTTGYCFPLASDLHLDYAGRFPFLWWIRGLSQDEVNAKGRALPDTIQRKKNYLIDALADDLNRYQPSLIVMHKGDERLALPQGYSYVTYFSQSSAFREAWLHYQRVAEVGQVMIYQRTS